MNNDDDEAVRVMQPRRMRGHISMRVNDVYRWRMKFAASSTELRTTKSIIDEERGSG
jgi:plasmid maintenance system killer protein